MPSSEKVDLYKLHKADYATPKKPILLTIKAAQYLVIVGRGKPGGESFTTRIGALYGVAYTVKMASKFAGRDYVVCKLEAVWWGTNKRPDFFKEDMSKWNWKLMIRTPDFIAAKEIEAAQDALEKKGKGPEVAEVKLETIDEGLCVQMLHVGPYDQEGVTVEVMKQSAGEQGLRFHGLHHEIYLSDPRRVAPERLKTILRLPVK